MVACPHNAQHILLPHNAVEDEESCLVREPHVAVERITQPFGHTEIGQHVPDRVGLNNNNRFLWRWSRRSNDSTRRRDRSGNRIQRLRCGEQLVEIVDFGRKL